ncbi:MAG: hypothetical protein ACRDLK_14175 [Gaiellaceae bacterium]
MASPSTTGSSTSVALLAIAGAFVAGIVIARCIDWMGHGHPKQ